MKVAVISDTHTMGPSRAVPPTVWPYLESADHILHAGDVCDPAVLDEMKALAPVTVVMGNCDPLSIREWGATD
ncbi:MAG TPA: metallophosphoesterase family protein, partial [Actinomycetota bacterium]|nr:metallophosphoesterase family protein [Actinomycetota bacterium]